MWCFSIWPNSALQPSFLGSSCEQEEDTARETPLLAHWRKPDNTMTQTFCSRHTYEHQRAPPADGWQAEVLCERISSSRPKRRHPLSTTTTLTHAPPSQMLMFCWKASQPHFLISHVKFTRLSLGRVGREHPQSGLCCRIVDASALKVYLWCNLFDERSPLLFICL